MFFNATKIRELKPCDISFKVSDSQGLYLLINPGGSRLWYLKYRIDLPPRIRYNLRLIIEQDFGPRPLFPHPYCIRQFFCRSASHDKQQYYRQKCGEHDNSAHQHHSDGI